MTIEESVNSKSQEKGNGTKDKQSVKSKRGKRAAQKNTILEPSESFDLTNEDFFISPMKSRRKLADEIPVTNVSDEIDLSILDSPQAFEESNTKSKSSNADIQQTKGGRKKGKAKQPRKVSYQKALKVLNAPVPELALAYPEPKLATNKDPTTTKNTQVSSTSRQTIRDYFSVDLTGEVTLSEFHNSEPLFQQKTDLINDKLTKQTEGKFEIDDLDDLDWDTIYVNVKIKDQFKKIKHKSEQCFYHLFKTIADQENVPVSSIYLYEGEKRIYPDDTLDMVGHKVSTIYTCHFMESSDIDLSTKDHIELKFQSDKWKRPITLKVSRIDQFSTFLTVLCKQIEFTPDKISLSFDGDSIDLKQTPLELDFEGGEILDCRVQV